MPSEWIETTIGEQATLQRGFDITKAEQKPGDVPVISSSGVNSYHDTVAVSGPGVVLGRKGVVGSVHYTSRDYWPHDTTLWVKDFHGNLPRFVYFFFRSFAPRLVNMDVGSANPTLNRNHVHPIVVRWPSLPDQKAIACILGALDDKIELNRRMNETLEAMAQAIFKSWFVDFDPVRAKAAGEQPPGLAPHIADLFPDAFEESELGEIPEGWREGTVGEGFNITMGQSPPGETYNGDGDGLPFYQGRRDFGFRFPSLRVYCTAPTRFAQHGDTLVSVRAPVGDINMAAEECCVGRGVAAVRHRTGSRSYTYYAMKSLRTHFDRFEAEGTVFGSLNRRDFHNLPFLISLTQTIESFERLVFPIDQLIETSEQQTQTLAELRDTLLPKLISGELRVPDAERFCVEAGL
jgi:type I restriction enzyme S subunit